MSTKPQFCFQNIEMCFLYLKPCSVNFLVKFNQCRERSILVKPRSRSCFIEPYSQSGSRTQNVTLSLCVQPTTCRDVLPHSFMEAKSPCCCLSDRSSFLILNPQTGLQAEQAVILTLHINWSIFLPKVPYLGVV